MANYCILWDYFTVIFMDISLFSFGATQAKFPDSPGDVGHAIFIYVLISGTINRIVKKILKKRKKI
jgi:hypothetical protein